MSGESALRGSTVGREPWGGRQGGWEWVGAPEIEMLVGCERKGRELLTWLHHVGAS